MLYGQFQKPIQNKKDPKQTAQIQKKEKKHIMARIGNRFFAWTFNLRWMELLSLFTSP